LSIVAPSANSSILPATVLIDRHTQDLTVSRIVDVQEVLLRVESQIVRADILVRIA
jgi:hypothetical protein